MGNDDFQRRVQINGGREGGWGQPKTLGRVNCVLRGRIPVSHGGGGELENERADGCMPEIPLFFSLLTVFFQKNKGGG